jgi:hypothetical protein
MAKGAAETVICTLITKAHDRMEEADAIVNAANGLAKRGKATHALRVLMDFEGPSHEAHDMFRAALTISRHLLATED